jgi:hypothetical protein
MRKCFSEMAGYPAVENPWPQEIAHCKCFSKYDNTTKCAFAHLMGQLPEELVNLTPMAVSPWQDPPRGKIQPNSKEPVPAIDCPVHNHPDTLPYSHKSHNPNKTNRPYTTRSPRSPKYFFRSLSVKTN